MEIPLRLGSTKSTLGPIVAYALVDPEDHERLSSFRWTISNYGYACRTLSIKETAGVLYPRRTLLMHRAILGLDFGDPLQGDHLNRNRLDNRRANLRIVPREGQSQNKITPGGSIYRGVFRSVSGRRWIAKVQNRHLGTFDTEYEAAQAAAAERARCMPYAVD
jgi:hypothetical protein